MAVRMGSKQLAPVQGEDAAGRVAAVLLSLPDGDDNTSAEAGLRLDPLHPEPVAEAQRDG